MTDDAANFSAPLEPDGSLRPLTRAERKLARRCSVCGDFIVMNDPMQHVQEKHFHGPDGLTGPAREFLASARVLAEPYEEQIATLQDRLDRIHLLADRARTMCPYVKSDGDNGHRLVMPVADVLDVLTDSPVGLGDV